MLRRIRVVVYAILLTLLALPTYGIGQARPDRVYHRFVVRQSDGYEFEVWDDGEGCFPTYETADGYAVLRDSKTGDWYYAGQNTRGALIPSQHKVGSVSPAAIGLKKYGKTVIYEDEERSMSRGKIARTLQSVPQEGAKSVLIIFGKLQGDLAPDPLDPAAENAYEDYYGNDRKVLDMLDPDLEGSLSHFIEEMSYDKLHLLGNESSNNLVLQWWESNSSDATAYPPGAYGAIDFAGEVLQNVNQNADPNFSFADYDNDGPDGIPNSGDDDGFVDLVVFLYDRPPLTRFSMGTIRGDLPSHDIQTRDGVTIRDVAIGAASNDGGTAGFELVVGISSHEYGHILDLPELYDRSHYWGGVPPEDHSAGLGLWANMAHGDLGWADAEWWPTDPPDRKWNNGPNPFSIWSRIRLGWIDPIPVTSNRLGETIQDINSGGDVYKIQPDPARDEYFLVCNRQPSGSYYTRNDPASGLLIYHVDEARIPAVRGDANTEELHKGVDLECPDGLWDAAGAGIGAEDPISGRDNLDFWSDETAYRDSLNGNKGDSEDVFDGITYTSFTPYTNPNSNAYSGPTANDTLQNVPTHIAVTNIHEAVPGVMKADILFNYWSGEITTNTTWSNDANGNPIYVGGDITIPSGVTLTISPGTEVLFAANSDDRGGGYDPDKSELIVEGTLEADGVTFRSDSDSPANSDWQGIKVASGGSITLTNSTIQHAQNGVWLSGTAPAVLEDMA